MSKTTGITCLGIIMDGNRRWAKAQGLPNLEGHRRGFEKIRECGRWVRDAGIKHLALYAFSTENWNRSAKEVEYLMTLFESMLDNELADLKKERVRVRFVGQRERFPETIQKRMRIFEVDTEKAHDLTLHVLLSYGGRTEIVAVANALIKKGKQVTEDEFAKALWTAPMPDPDLIVRTGGEQRLSNFLTWQSVYSELFFTKTLWPDFSKEEFDAILADFATRERRHGK